MTNIDNVKEQATGFISDQVDRRTTDLGNVVGDHVNNLRSMSDSLRSQGQTPTATLVEAAAERLDQLSSYLRNADGNSLMHDLESVARKQPVVTATVGLVTGFLAARVLKAGASQRYRSYTEDASTSYGETSPAYAGMQGGYGTDDLGGSYASPSSTAVDAP